MSEKDHAENVRYSEWVALRDVLGCFGERSEGKSTLLITLSKPLGVIGANVCESVLSSCSKCLDSRRFAPIDVNGLA